ncbi:unnamed protein product [Moneuplotes crassus]|uniref:Uncharacterized protein n=1 Tax=Euplotes crassus TaxID=5936 RepID=A0AAD1U507_EUPCR|nr:unnamed protein product [Moneuplotes crassus]
MSSSALLQMILLNLMAQSTLSQKTLKITVINENKRILLSELGISDGSNSDCDCKLIYDKYSTEKNKSNFSFAQVVSPEMIQSNKFAERISKKLKGNKSSQLRFGAQLQRDFQNNSTSNSSDKNQEQKNIRRNYSFELFGDSLNFVGDFDTPAKKKVKDDSHRNTTGIFGGVFHTDHKLALERCLQSLKFERSLKLEPRRSFQNDIKTCYLDKIKIEEHKETRLDLKPYQKRLAKTNIFNYDKVDRCDSKLSTIATKWHRHTFGLNSQRESSQIDDDSIDDCDEFEVCVDPPVFQTTKTSAIFPSQKKLPQSSQQNSERASQSIAQSKENEACHHNISWNIFNESPYLNCDSSLDREVSESLEETKDSPTSPNQIIERMKQRFNSKAHMIEKKIIKRLLKSEVQKIKRISSIFHISEAMSEKEQRLPMSESEFEEGPNFYCSHSSNLPSKLSDDSSLQRELESDKSQTLFESSMISDFKDPTSQPGTYSMQRSQCNINHPWYY